MPVARLHVATSDSGQRFYHSAVTVANASGSTNNPVSTSITFTDAFGNGQLPPSYSVHLTPSQSGVWATVTNKTTSGFNAVLTPLSGQAIAAGTMDVLVAG
jgi:hypothetical protein